MGVYVSFLKAHHQSVGFGLLLTFFSSFGQTFLISLYVPFILRDLAMTNTAFGSLYAAATICSAILLVLFGKRVDHAPLRPFTYRTILLLSISTISLGYSVGEMVLPLLITALLPVLGWRITLGPMVFGWVLDAGVSFGQLFIGPAIIAALGTTSSFRLWSTTKEPGSRKRETKECIRYR